MNIAILLIFASQSLHRSQPLKIYLPFLIPTDPYLGMFSVYAIFFSSSFAPEPHFVLVYRFCNICVLHGIIMKPSRSTPSLLHFIIREQREQTSCWCCMWHGRFFGYHLCREHRKWSWNFIPATVQRIYLFDHSYSLFLGLIFIFIFIPILFDTNLLLFHFGRLLLE